MSVDRKKERLKYLTVVCIIVVAFDIIAAVLFLHKKNNEKDTPTVPEEQSSAEEVSCTEAESETTEPAEEDKDPVEERLAKMSLHDKICQMFIITPEMLTDGIDVKEATEATKDALEKNPVGGLIYFEKNLEAQYQIANVIRKTNVYVDETGCVPLFYGVDEEGGQVARCADSVGTVSLDSMYYYKELGTDAAYSNARMIAGDIAKLGFNLDFAPVADTWSNHDNRVIGTRAYSDDFKETAVLVEAAVKGYRDGKLFCTLKHFPGHGDTVEDSHYSLAVSNKTADKLKENEYLAFESGIKAGADMVMTGHILVPAIDELPASLSEKIIQGELREKLGYDGVVITDSLHMGAITNTYTSADAAVMAVNAGNDILLIPDNFQEALDGVEQAVKSGKITEERIDESVRRILRLKKERMEI